MPEQVAEGPPEVHLRDGSSVLIRPLRRSDKELLREAFDGLSDESRYRRFLAPMPALSESALRYLTNVDHHGHEALIALDPRSGQAVGVGRYVRTDRSDVAEAAVTVADAWQGRGLGTALLELLAARAREEDIVRFVSLLLTTNEEMIDLLHRLGPGRIVHRESGTIEIESELPPVGLDPGLRAVLRLCAKEEGAARRRAT